MKSQWEDPEYRKIQTEKIKSRWMNPEWAVDMRRRYSESLKAQWENPEYREKHTEISRIIFSSPENQEKQKKAMEIKWAEPTFKAMQRKKGSAQFRSPEFRKQISKKMKERWEDPEFINKFLKSQNTSPNKLEQIINSLTPEIVEFVGNRKWWRTLKIKDENGNEIIRHKNPDFIVKGHHKVIEIFGDYWHRGDTPEKWHEAWEKIGYKLLIIWEHDIYENIENTLNNINNFIGGTNEQTI
jgi:very-short-patch-repair endonuclease